LKAAVCCALFFMIVEIFGGVFANSLAIVTDAAHMLSDVGGFIVSLVALQLSAHGATADYTYGFRQAEVLGALLSIAIVWALTAVLLWEAVPRFVHPEPIDAPVMFTISSIGFVVNLILMKVLGHGHSHGGDDHGHSHGGHDEHDSVAVQAALAHVIGDIVQSLGVCLAALCIWIKPFDVGETEDGVSKWNYMDPMCTVMFGVLVLLTTKSTLVRAVETLMGKAPKHIDQDKLRADLERIPNVDSIHDLHVWALGSRDVLCTAHVMISCKEHSTSTLKAAIKVAQAAGIGHSTFQIEICGEFDPTLETYGTLHGNETSNRNLTEILHKSDGHSHDGGHSHDAGHKHNGGHSHDAGHGHDGGHSHCGGHASDAGHSHGGGHAH